MVVYGSVMPAATKILQPVVNPNEIVELKRLYLDDIDVKNLESYVIAKSLKLVKDSMPEIKAVITFADDKVGHTGTIYQATNAIYLGKSPSGKHKYLYILRDKSRISALVKDRSSEYPQKQS